MTKRELATLAASKTPYLTQNQMLDAIAPLVAAIIEGVAKGHVITIQDFGKFGPSIRKAHTGRNPKTGAAVKVPQKVRPKFTPYPYFKTRVEDGYKASKLTKPKTKGGLSK